MTRRSPFYTLILIAAVLVTLCTQTVVAAAEPLQLSSSEQAWLAAHPSIRVAFDGHFPPYSFLNDHGEFEGLAVDVMQRLAARIGVKVEPFPQAVWKDLYAAAQRREVDVVATMGDRPERAAWFVFTQPYIFKSLVIMIHEGNESITSPKDLAGKRVALVKGYQYVQPLLEKYPSIRPYYVDTMLDGMNAVVVGKADAVITFTGAGHYLKTKYQLTALIFAAVFERDSFNESIGIRNDWPVLATILDKALDSISEDEMLALQERWIGPEIAPGISRRLAFTYLEMILGGGILLVAGFLLWTRTLKRQVANSTAELQQELAQHQETTAALQASEELFRHYFEQANIGFSLTSPQKGWLRANKYLCDILGYQEAELLAKNWAEMTHPEDLEADVQQFNRLLAGEIDSYELDKRFYRKNGDLFPTHLTVSCLRNPDGSANLINATLEDITERKQTEEKLRRNEHLLRLFVEHSPASIAMFDRDMKYIVASRRYCKDYDLANQDLSGRSHYDVFPEVSERWREIHQQCLAGAIEKCEDDPFPRADGHIDLVRWEIHPWHEIGGEIGGIILFSEVVTERKQAELELKEYRTHLEELVAEQTVDLHKTQRALQFMLEDLNEANTRLREIDQLKSMFIASMSHELRTPLNAVIGFSSILLNEWTGPLNDEQKQNVASVLRSGKHLLSLINDVIDLSKVEAGMIEVNHAEFELAELLTELKLNFSKKAQDKQLFLTLPELQLTMHTDRRRLLQCLMNLVSNALKYTEQGGVRVDIQQDTPKDTVTISVTDTGIGIAEDDQAKLFQAFSRIPSAYSAGIQGTGLGLYLTKKIVLEILWGTIKVTSEPNQGSSFSICIPCRVDKNPQGETTAAKEESA